MSEDDQVRRLLADARHTEPMPDDVATRLDEVLAGLADDRPAAPAPAVTDLAPRRWRRAGTLLVAAAAVVVAGVGIQQVLDGANLADDDADSATSSEVTGSSAAGEGDSRPESANHPAVPGPVDAEAPGSPVRVASDELDKAARQLRDDGIAVRNHLGYLSAQTFDRTGCDVRAWGAGQVVRIRYDASPAALVYRAPRGGQQTVDLFLCGSPGVARTITLPAR